jgi:hypothetical protein
VISTTNFAIVWLLIALASSAVAVSRPRRPVSSSRTPHPRSVLAAGSHRPRSRRGPGFVRPPRRVRRSHRRRPTPRVNLGSSAPRTA